MKMGGKVLWLGNFVDVEELLDLFMCLGYNI